VGEPFAGKIGPVSGAQLDAQVKSAVAEVLSKLPNADKLYLEQMMFASYCSALRDDASLKESEKAERIVHYRQTLQATIKQSAVENPPVWISNQQRSQWGWGSAYINNQCGPSDLSGIEIQAPTLGNREHDYDFMVRCRIDRTPAKYTIEMEHAAENETALETQDRLQDKLNKLVTVVGDPYWSTDKKGKFFWYVYRLN
jgi:hypothetical protein